MLALASMADLRCMLPRGLPGGGASGLWHSRIQLRAFNVARAARVVVTPVRVLIDR
jgi:hypothetical protein